MLNKLKSRVYTRKSYMRQFLSDELYVLARKHEHFCSDFMWQIHLLKSEFSDIYDLISARPNFV